MITIYDRKGNRRADIAADDSSTQRKEVQGDNVLALSFTHHAHIAVDVNDYTDFMGERYWLTERYTPKQVSEGEWRYDLKLYGIESLVRRFLVLETTDGDAEPVFTLTATPREHVALVVSAVNAGMGDVTDWKVGQVDGTELIIIDYEGMYCNEALKAIAEKVGGKAEWWVEGQTVNVCRCEHGESITLGYGGGLVSLERVTGSTAGFYTRLFPIGSSRNIDPEKYGSSRLMLPGGKKFVEVGVDEYGIFDRYERDAFSGIYPRRVGTVSGVRSKEVKDKDGEPYTVYYFSDASLDFDPNSYELPGAVKRVSFQDGELAGLGKDDGHYFDVNFDSDTREFEIVTIWPYDDGMQLPGDTLVPKVGDRYIIWNIRMPDEYYPSAEKEFSDAVDKYNREHWQDIGVYKAPTDHVWVEEHGADLFIGRRVRLESRKYFPDTGYRDSRITKITRNVNLPSKMDLEISDALSSGTLEQIRDGITGVQNYIRDVASSLPDIIRTGDRTLPTDNNLYSARRCLYDFFSRLYPDTAYGTKTFMDPVRFGEFVDSLIAGKGAGIFPDGRAQVERLEVRGSLSVLDLIINQIQGMESDYSFTEIGKIESVEDLGENTYRLKIEKRTDFDFMKFQENDVCFSIINTLLTGGSDYYTSWMRILTTNAQENSITVVLYPDSEVPGGMNYPPLAGYNVTRRGNSMLPEEGGFNGRAQSWMISSREGRIMFLSNVYKPILEDYNYSISIGRFPRTKALEKLPISENETGVMAQTVIAEKFYQLDHNGDVIPNKVDRGIWSLETAQSGAPYRFVQYELAKPSGSEYTLLEQHTVYHLGCKWGCLKDKTTDEPKWNSPSWGLLEGDSRYSLQLSISGGEAFVIGGVDEVISGRVFYGTIDITDDVMADGATEVEWFRDSGNVPADNLWTPEYVDGNRLAIHIDNGNQHGVGSDFGFVSRSVAFICRVFIPVEGEMQQIEQRFGFDIL